MAGLVRDRLIAVDLGLSFYALGRKLKNPGEDDDRDKTERQDNKHDRQCGVVELQRVEQNVPDLQEQPAQYEVGESHADYVATLEFGKKVHAVSWFPKASGEYTGKVDRLVYTQDYPAQRRGINSKQGGQE
jgi:hypothetical protein